MREEEIIEKCELIAYVGTSCYTVDEDKKAIQGLVDLYNKEKEKNKKIENKIKEYEKITQDTVDCLKIIDKYRFCKVEKLKDFYKEIKEIFEGE